MNYYDESQEQYEEIAVQSTDNMPVGAVIEYSGNDIPVGWEKVNDYSTTEQDTGKTWIDGKKIYRKVIQETISTSGTHNISIGESNLSTRMIKYWHFATGSYILNEFDNGEINTWLDSNGIVFVNPSSFSTGSFLAIVEYTKTND